MADRSEVRVSDQEREQVAQEIREHYAVGRLDNDELDDRVTAVYAARTAGELELARKDLPRLPAARAQQKTEIAERRSHLQRRLIQQTGGSLTLFLICTVVWVASGASGQFWPIWVALVALLPLVRNGWAMYGPAPDLDKVERDLAQREQREQRPGPPAI
jgi:uncharacterized protein DUF1707